MSRGFFPLVSLMGSIATGIVLLVVGAMVGGMVFIIRLMSDDSDKFKEVKAYMETIFGTPAHLRSSEDETAQEKDDGMPALLQKPFSDLCPACEEPVTHENAQCPACGLRLL
ncbi:hypothetical protein [Paenibacillus nasutitermitis]|uniref:Uncharacterized protein n=1 Tax=Paenibacillus nasutitermitis TaxID=1652958 RepID=A0A916ZCV1_9BACL|nr:hypothetical protein [Paenibacillus nasutitermitis]GGD86764.1 hypothetical protein GCM10010911_51550 [Paenibacillus nasutitermitis]